jgi:methyl-accepting chemotaxis protein
MAPDRPDDTRRAPGHHVGEWPRLAPDVRVLMAVSSLVALLVIGVLIATTLVAGVHGAAIDLADREVRYAVSVDDAALQAKGIANDERGFLLSGRMEFLAQIEDRVELARSAFARGAVAADDLQREALADASVGFERWLAMVRTAIRAAQSGDHPAAVDASMGPSRTLRKAYEASLANARSLAADAIRLRTDSVADASARSTTILVAYVAVMLLVGVGVGAWIVRSVMRPTYALLHILSDPEPFLDRA